jgi:hypothetical protein
MNYPFSVKGRFEFQLQLALLCLTLQKLKLETLDDSETGSCFL